MERHTDKISMGEIVGSLESHLGRRQGFSPGLEKDKSSASRIWFSKARRSHNLSTTCRSGFSKSLGDLSQLSGSRNGFSRKSVAFEEDLYEHDIVLERARTRFRQLELKYPEIFKQFSRTSSVSSLADRSVSSSHEHEHADGMDTLQVPRINPDSKSGGGSNTTARRAPRLSVAMRVKNLEDSCDSAFDEVDRDSIHSRASQDPSSIKSPSLLHPCDSLESDKDSGISTDRPFIPQGPKYGRPVRWAESEDNLDIEKAGSLQSVGRISSSTEEYPREDRRGILKSAAYKNQGSIQSESADVLSLSERRRFCQQDTREVLSRSKGTSVYRRTLLQGYLSPDETDDSDAETVCSRRSEVILRPNMSARDIYFSTYQLNSTGDSTDNSTNRVYKCKSMPELARISSLGSSIEVRSYDSEVTHADFKEEKKKRNKRKFGRRSGLYVVNDMPVIEKPRRLSVDNKPKAKPKLFSRKKLKSGPVHINESTKKWFDNQTAVSRPSGGTSLGRIVAMCDSLGPAYQLELKRSKNTLFGFFIQKGYKQFRRGVFVSRIMDSSSAKFLSGLLNPGDEILEINGQSTEHKTIAEVHSIMAESDMLSLTVLPYLSRKDW